MPPRERTEPRILLLDGGMGQELLHRGIADDPLLWSATALVDNANVVKALHSDYLDAGADVITTHTCATNLRRFGADRGRFERVNRLAGDIARSAIDDCGRTGIILAGSLPPTRGSYRPEQVPPFERMLEEYRPQVEVLADYVDVFLCETMSSAEEGRAAATAARQAGRGKPVWVSWTLQDGGSDRLRSGEPLARAQQALQGLDVEAHLVNCCSPESATRAMPTLARGDARRFGAYANGFVAVPPDWIDADGADALGKRRDLDPAGYATHARRWLDAGATLIGGCCEIGPTHIAALRQLIDSR